jgi:Rrf2 family protein
MFSKACEYAIRSCIFIATKSMNNERVNLKSIAKEIDSPEAFTAKILQQLAKNNIIQSLKGPTGGFTITIETMTTIKLRNIVLAIDGDGIYSNCVLGMKDCSEQQPCPVHFQYKSIKAELLSFLENTNLKQLCSGLESGETFLKISKLKA